MPQNIQPDPDHMAELAVMWMRAQPAVGAFVRSGVRDMHDVEEILQEIAATVVSKFEDYDPNRPFTTWVLGIARLKVLEFLRKQSTDRHVFDSDTLVLLANAHEQTASDYSPRKEALAVCLDQLKGRARQVIDMRYLREMKSALIAERLGMSRNAVFILLHRTRMILSKCIERRLASKGDHQS